MVIKSLTRKSGTGQLVKYVCRYIANPEKQSGKQFLIRHNLKGKSLDGFIAQFKENAQARKFKRSDMVVIRHTILSFSPKSREYITDVKLKAIAKEYIKQAGDTSLFLMSKHDEGVKHTHIHVVQSSGTISGKSANLTRDQFAQLKLSMSNFIKERYPELCASLVNHGRGREERQKAVPKLEQFHTHKSHITETVSKTLSQAKSLDTFLSQLSEAGLHPYYRGSNNTLTGIQSSSGQRYRFSTLGVKEQLQELQKAQEKEQFDLAELRELRERTEDRDQENEPDDVREFTDEEDTEPKADPYENDQDEISEDYESDEPEEEL